MPLRKVTIISNNICYGPVPEPDDEVEQRLTLNAKGQVWFTGYAYGDGFGKHSPCRKQRLSIGTESAFRVLAMFEQYFSGDYPVFYATDIGTWELTMTDEAGTSKKETGSLCADLLVGGNGISQVLRELLPIENMFLFDENCGDEDEQE